MNDSPELETAPATSTVEHQPLQATALRCFLILVTIAAGIRLAGFAAEFARTSAQADFLAYFMAGRSAARGLSPYVNNGLTDRSLWDTSDSRHSRFFYPPLAATVFRGLGAMDYLWRKSIWMGLNLLCLAIVMAMSWKMAGVRSTNAGLAAVAVCLMFHPLLALLELGQVELILLVLILAAVAVVRRPAVGWQIAGGLLLAAAALFKLHLVYALPFIFVWRRWGILAGFIAGGMVLLGLSIAIDGRAAVSDYVQVQMPRIAAYGQSAEPAAQIPQAALEAAVGQQLPDKLADPVVVDARGYRARSFEFGSNATLVRYLTRLKSFPTASRASAGCYIIVAGLVMALLWPRRNRAHALAGAGSAPRAEFRISEKWVRDADPTRSGRALHPYHELIFWLVILAIVLITGPMTWVMALVWLLPIPFVIAGEATRLRDRRQARLLGLALFGWIIIALPDSASFAMFFPFVKSVSTKYVMGEAIVLLSLAVYLRQAPDSTLSA